jgi:DNA-directed RNA polymerase subunit K/omega
MDMDTYLGADNDDNDDNADNDDNDNDPAPEPEISNEWFEGPMKDYETKKKSYKTTPVLTKYEKTRILGQRANQIINGSKPLIPHPEEHGNPYDIAVQELNQKKIPFIIKRPYGNTFEYWKLEDLEDLN